MRAEWMAGFIKLESLSNVRNVGVGGNTPLVLGRQVSDEHSRHRRLRHIEVRCPEQRLDDVEQQGLMVPIPVGML